MRLSSDWTFGEDEVRARSDDGVEGRGRPGLSMPFGEGIEPRVCATETSAHSLLDTQVRLTEVADVLAVL